MCKSGTQLGNFKTLLATLNHRKEESTLEEGQEVQKTQMRMGIAQS